MKIREHDAVPISSMQGMSLFWCVVKENFWDLLLLNLYCVLFSLPVVTFPAAIAATHSIVQRMVRGEVYSLFSDFFSAFKRLFWRALLAGLCVYSGPLLSLYVVPFYRGMLQYGFLFALPIVVVILFSIFQCMLGFYLFTMLDTVEQPFGVMLKNASLLAIIRLPKNFLALLATAGLCLLTLIGLPLTLILVICLLFSFSSLIAAFCAWPGIAQFVVKSNSPQRDAGASGQEK